MVAVKDGKLIIDEQKAENVKLIFDLYLSGQSVIGIIKELEKRNILSPTGGEKWCKKTITNIVAYQTIPEKHEKTNKYWNKKLKKEKMEIED